MDVVVFRRCLIAIILSYVFSASASSITDGYLYEQQFTRLGLDYLDLLQDLPTDDFNSLPADKKSACLSRYQGILNDGVLDIRVALGYFDWSTGSAIGSYGLSPSMDLGAYSALRDMLTERCTKNLKFCGFQQDPQNPYLFSRTVTIFGQKYPVRLQMHFSSVSEYYANNIGPDRDKQVARTEFMNAYFASALQTADAVFYFGHSRNGGGPDFAPPHLNSAHKVDFDGYYEVYKPGLKKVLAALANPSKQTAIFALMSCDSRDHFLRTLRAIAPHMGVITSTAVLDVDQVYTAMIGGIDALLRGQCQRSFYQELRMTPKNQEFITMDGMFE